MGRLERIASRVYGHGKGWAFSAQDFLDIAAREMIDSYLRRLLAKGTIRRVICGVYDYPKFSELLGVTLSPDLEKVAHALARKFHWTLSPTEAATLNLEGKSTQVPGRLVYNSNGPNRIYTVGKSTIEFRKLRLSGKRANEYNGLHRILSISKEHYAQMLEDQNGCCAICGKHRSQLKQRLRVDHDHATGAVRGLLCPSCNGGLGHFRDSIAFLTKAVDYLAGGN